MDDLYLRATMYMNKSGIPPKKKNSSKTFTSLAWFEGVET